MNGHDMTLTAGRLVEHTLFVSRVLSLQRAEFARLTAFQLQKPTLQYISESTTARPKGSLLSTICYNPLPREAGLLSLTV